MFESGNRWDLCSVFDRNMSGFPAVQYADLCTDGPTTGSDMRKLSDPFRGAARKINSINPNRTPGRKSLESESHGYIF